MVNRKRSFSQMLDASEDTVPQTMLDSSSSSSSSVTEDVEMTDTVPYSLGSFSSTAVVPALASSCYSPSTSSLPSSSLSCGPRPPAATWIAHPYNFFVFPADGVSAEFACESEAIAFNRDHCMDFNKW